MSEKFTAAIGKKTDKRPEQTKQPIFSDDISALSKVRPAQEDFVKILQRDEGSIGRAERERFIQGFTGRVSPDRDAYRALAQELSKRPGNFEGAGSLVWSHVLAQDLEQLSFLKEKLKGADLVDLGAGENEFFRPLAVLFEVRSYVDVDLYPFKEKLSYLKEQRSIESKGMKDIRLDLPKLAWKRFAEDERRSSRQDSSSSFDEYEDYHDPYQSPRGIGSLGAEQEPPVPQGPQFAMEAVDKEKFEERSNVGQDMRAHVGSTEQYLVKADMLDFVSRVPDHSADFVLNAIDIAIIGSGEYVQALARELKRATRLGGIVMCMTSEEVQAELEKNSFKRVHADPKSNHAIFIRESDPESPGQGS